MQMLKIQLYSYQSDSYSKIISHTFIKTVLLIRTVFLFLPSSMAIAKKMAIAKINCNVNAKKTLIQKGT